MVTAAVIVTLGLSPGNGGRSDEGAGIGFVLVGEQDAVAGAQELAAVGGFSGEGFGDGGATPLDDEAAAKLGEGHGEGFQSLAHRSVMAFADADGDCEHVAVRTGEAGEIELAHEGDVAIGGRAEFPVHLEVVFEVAPAVTGADKAATDAGEAGDGRAAACGHGQRPLIFPGEENPEAGDVHGAGGVAGAAVVEMGGEQGVDLEAGEQIGVAFQAEDSLIVQAENQTSLAQRESGDQPNTDRCSAASPVGHGILRSRHLDPSGLQRRACSPKIRALVLQHIPQSHSGTRITKTHV